MSAVFGPEENQDMVPLSTVDGGGGVCDPHIRLQPEDDAEPARHEQREPEERRPSRYHMKKPHRRHAPQPRSRPVSRDGPTSSSRPLQRSQTRHDRHSRTEQRDRTYRPSSPTESVQSDFEILANIIQKHFAKHFQQVN